jgi:hypothetical protein
MKVHSSLREQDQLAVLDFEVTDTQTQGRQIVASVWLDDEELKELCGMLCDKGYGPGA